MSFSRATVCILLSAFGAIALKADNVDTPLSCAADLFSATYLENTVRPRRFSLQATITLPCCERRHRTVAIEDETGAMLVTFDRLDPAFSVRRGDRVELAGTIAADSFGHPCASCSSARVIAHGTATNPSVADLGGLASAEYRFRVVEIDGMVADAFTDEIDPNYMFIILNHNRHQVTVATEAEGRIADDCQALIGQRVSVLGVCRPNMYGVRTHFGLNIRTTPENIRIVVPDRPDPFAVKDLDETRLVRPDEVASPERRRICGAVVAAWSDGHALVRSDRGRLVRISVSHGITPEHGQTVEAVGFPETDLYRINLTRCLCRARDGSAPHEEDATPVTATELMCDPSGRQRYNTDYHGRRIRISGRVLGYSPLEGAVAKAMIESNGFHIPVYFSARHEIAQRIPVNSVVEIDGTCVMDAESWSPYTFFPRIKEVLISVASADRIRLLARPPWWTPGKFTVVCLVLLIALSGIITWSMALKRAVVRKGRELKREITARLASNLKTRERTRLAVELHDSIAQTLSGTAMEIGSALRCSGSASPVMLAHLQTASQTLRSCRDDLRDCLWDLRSNALEVDSMDEAIRTTIRPIIGDATPIVRFNVLRKRLSDNTAHALLRIIHELVSNAVRHGQAKTIRIAGSISGRRLLFSVRDDGCGFDLANHPDAKDGHFGLEGVRERIRRFNGTLSLESTPGAGTKATIALDVSLPEEEDLIET